MPKLAKSGDTLKIFVPINKIDEEQRLVYGQAAAEVLDNSGEMFDYAGSKPYFEKWSENAYATSGGKSHGNIRVMHTSKVAGIVNAPLGFDDDAKTIDCVAKVVDDAEWAMVLAGGYTGFSMGGRYVSRAKKSDNITRYVAEPVEISLVDKPCIPTATFSVVKADGLVEEHRFREDLYKTDTGEASMYVPTNDEILPVAQGLAKAAGKTDADWLDFVEPATAELVAKHAEAEGVTTEAAPEAKDPAAATEEAPVVKADGHDMAACDKADCPDCATAKADKPNPFADKGKDKDDGDDEGDDKDAKDKSKKAAKSDFGDLQQGWRAKDGSFHIAKADAVAHNDTLTKGEAEPTLAERLEKLNKNAAAVLSGEAVEAEAGAAGDALKATTISEIADPLAKFKAFADSTLVKGMFSIQRLAETISCLDGLHCMVACEEAWEDDQTSKLPQMLLDGMKSLGQTLVAMATEEVNELIASGMAMDTRNGVTDDADAPILIDTVIVELACTTLGLEKSAFETNIADRLQKRTPVAVVADPDTLAKVASAETERDAALAKAEGLSTELAKIEPLVKGLQDQMDQILKMPRGPAPTTRVIGKGDSIDTLAPGGPGDGSGNLLEKYTPAQLTDAAIRMSQQHGRHFVLPQQGQ